jgi:hypothetical protein
MTQSVHDTTTGTLRNGIRNLLRQSSGFQGTIGTYDGPAQTGFRPKRREAAHQGKSKFLQGRTRVPNRASLSITAHASCLGDLQTKSCASRSRQLFLANRRHLTADPGVDYWGQQPWQSCCFDELFRRVRRQVGQTTAEADLTGHGIARQVAGWHAVCSTSGCAKQCRWRNWCWTNQFGPPRPTSACSRESRWPIAADHPAPGTWCMRAVLRKGGRARVQRPNCCKPSILTQYNPTGIPSLTVSPVERERKTAGEPESG